ncbi:MAG: sialate O-acetylesterase [Planctomycetota bacterium]
MQIERGLFPHMVLQRTARNASDARVSGTTAAAGPVLAAVTRKGRPVSGFARQTVGMAKAGRFTARLTGLPAGGPYDIRLTVGATSVTVRDVLVGDVWLLGGQSNMQGCGLQTGAARPEPLVRAFFMDDTWAPAKDPLHNFDVCVDQVHIRLMGGVRPPGRNTVTGVGPGVAFGQEMRRRTGVPQGLIACGHGGTSMTQWDPALKKDGTSSLCGAMLRRFEKNGGRAAGLVWYQGCSDADADAAPLYTKRMVKFVQALRRDTRLSDLPVAMVQIGRCIHRTAPEQGIPWNAVQDQQRRLPQVIKHLTVVPAVDLPLDDSIHISGTGQQVLGRRLAYAMQVVRQGRRAGLPPIAVKKIACGHDHSGMAQVVVEFAHVAGGLTANGRPAGFELGGPVPGHHVYAVELRGSRAIVRTDMPANSIASKWLYYGPGADTYCNITDSAGRSLPVFGPLTLGEPAAVTPFFRRLRVSRFQPSAGRLEDLACPVNTGRLGFTERDFSDDFCDLHLDIAKQGKEDKVVYFACRFDCAEAMKLTVLIGYDGPCKAWIDRKQVFHDPKGVNPALPTDKARIPFRAAAGWHEIIVALATNNGAAWGIYLQMERTDVPTRVIKKGPEAYAMPKLLG